MSRLGNKVCVITGGASGIGEGVAKRFAAEGGKVVILDRDVEGMQRVTEEIRKVGGTVDYRMTDVLYEEQIIEAFEFVNSTYGEMHVLHTNTWWAAKRKVTELSLEDWNKSMAVTLTAPFLCSKYAIPLMIKAGGGSIIHTSSNGAVVVFREYADYITAKAGVLQLSKSIAVDFGVDKIRCNAICPGIIDTPSTKDDLADPEYSKYLLSKCLMGEIGQPEDVAAISVFLASDESKFITGSVIMVDSGWSII
jgi:NAD(P)-dependent dehydrogenase (short-subunit alcohol dehydrogenase family)